MRGISRWRGRSTSGGDLMCKGGGGQNTNTVVQQQQPPPQFLNAYSNAVSQAQQVAGQPYQPYTGQIVAPLNAYQQSAIQSAPNLAASYTPWAQQAEGYLGQATTPFYQTVGQYESPYINDVVNSTEQQFNNQNAIQQGQVQGNAVAQGAWGGDRSAVAQGIVAGQQQANEAPVIAGLYNQGYQTALNANEAQNWLNSQAAAQTGQLGAQTYGVGLGQLNEEAQLGGLAQQESQAQLNVPYYQYLAGQAYPFQTTGWLSNIAEGLGAGAGGTSSTTSPAASPVSQALGLGIGGAGLLGATDAFGSSGWLTGAGGLLGGAAEGGSFDPALAGITDAGVQDFSGGILGAGGTGLLAGAARGGRIRRQDGGDVPFQLGPLPYQQIPASSNIPNVGISIVPQLPGQRAGLGPPRPPQGMPSGANGITPASILGSLQTSGALGSNGWLKQLLPTNPSGDAYDIGASPASGFPSQAAGGIVRPRYQGGGDLVSGLTPPDQPAYLGISPDMRAAPSSPVINAPQPAPSVNPASRAGIVNFWEQQGANPAAAQGIADRVAAESGFNPTAAGDLDTSYGLYQHHADRFDALRDFAADMGRPWTDPGVQNAFAASEVHGGDPIASKHWRQIEDAPDRATAATLWDKYFERSAGSQERGGSNQDVALGSAPPGAPMLEAQMTADGSYAVPPAGGLSQPPIGNGSGGIMGQPAGMYRPGVNPWMALAAAGFATAAGRSPQAMQNIGAGFLEGTRELEAERAALPEQELRLSQAQMARLQVQNAAAMHAYFTGQQADPQPVADQLDRNINAARQAVGDMGETHAIPTATGAVAPLPGGAPPLEAQMTAASQPAGAPLPLSADEQNIHGQVQQQIATIDGLIDRQAQLAQFATTPEQMAAMQGQLAQLAIRRSELLKEDPAYMRAASAASEEGKTPALVQQAGQEAQAKVGPAIQQAAGEAAAKLPYTPGYARPGSYITMGGVPTAGVPTVRKFIDPATGQEREEFFTPPLPGQTQAASNAPTGVAGQGTSWPAGLGPGQRESLETRAKEEQTDRQETIEGGVAAQQQQATLMQLKADAPNFVEGPFARHYQDIAKYARIFDPSWNGQVESFESFVKNAGALTRQAVHETSSRAAVQEFRLIGETLPEVDTSPQGLQKVANEYMGINDYKIAKAQAQQAWEQGHGGIGNVQGFETAFQGNVSPYAFIVNRMAPADRRQLVGQLRATPEGQRELSRISQQLQWIKARGLEPYIQ